MLLDSNAYTLLMRGHGQVTELVRRTEEGLFSAIVIGELMYGFRQGSQFERNAADLRSILNSPYASFVDVGPVTATPSIQSRGGIPLLQLLAREPGRAASQLRQGSRTRASDRRRHLPAS